MNSTSIFAILLIFACSATFADSPNWPQFRGPNRDGVAVATDLAEAWPKAGPDLVWTAVGAGRGYSSFSIQDGRLFTMGDAPSTADDEQEYLLCFDVKTGKQLWKQVMGKAWTSGPDDWQSSRSTPTIDGDFVYALTPHGDLFCCQVTTGEQVWKRNLKEDFDGGKADSWGYGESVLIDGELLICTPGKDKHTMVALKKSSGDLQWSAASAGDRGAGHASIQISHVQGTKVYVNTTGSGAMGVRASDGKLMWTYDIDKTTAVIPSPIIRDDLVFFVAGYNRGGALLRQRLEGDLVKIEEVYPLNRKLQNKHGGVVLIGDHLYGDTGDSGMPYCAELMTGEVQWKKRGSGKGSAALTAANGYLYFLFQNSTAVLAKASPDGYEEVGSFKLGSGDDARPTWAHPVITDGKLYLRQDDKIFCYDIGA